MHSERVRFGPFGVIFAECHISYRRVHFDEQVWPDTLRSVRPM